MARYTQKPFELEKQVEVVLRRCGAAYAVLDGNTIIPVGSDPELHSLEKAFADLAVSEFNGARAHLRAAGQSLTNGSYADSVRESIHAIESVARVLEPTATSLGPALAKLEKKAVIHAALRNGFANLYGFTSDEKGIRHALLDKGNANVDEADALYMLGASAAFISYVINKARDVGLMKKMLE